MNVQAQALATFDLDALDEVQRATHRCGLVFNAEGEAIAGVIMVGKNSSEYLAVSRANRIENIQRAGKRKTSIDSSTEEGAKTISETVEATDRAIALAVCVDWFGFSKGGKAIEFDQSMLGGMFDRAPQWQNKVLNDLENEANFMPASSKS